MSGPERDNFCWREEETCKSYFHRSIAVGDPERDSFCLGEKKDVKFSLTGAATHCTAPVKVIFAV